MNLHIAYKGLDKKTFEQLFNSHYEPLCRFASVYSKDADAVQEIVQDVFINLWQKRETIDTEKSVVSYLYTAVKNRCLNYIRDNKKFRSYYFDIEIEMEIAVQDADLLSEKETQIKILKALDQLPEKCRQVFELSRFEEMKYRDIADRLNISVKTVEVQISKALKILREELKEFLMILLILWMR